MFSILFVATVALIGAPAAAADRPPNVLLIYSDDQGAIDVNSYGSADLETPHMDELARTGVRFSQMYAPSSICSSSRAGLITGRFPVRVGVPANVGSKRGGKGLPTEEVTIAEMLHAAGYATGLVGKWHLGRKPETMPNGQGFDESFGHLGGCIDNYSHFFYWGGPNRHDLWRNGTEIWEEGRYFQDRMVEECQRFLRENKDHPFFLYWAPNIPHYPMQATAKWREHYKDMPGPRQHYAALVSTLDERIGMVLATLEELGLRDNTLVIFQSDHGHSVEERAFFGGGSAGDLRGAKGSLFEGGLRVPAIVSLPGVIPQGEVRDQMATGCDWMPTIAELCNVPLPDRPLDGKSLAQVIQSSDASTPHGRFLWHMENGDVPQWAIREGNWKLIGNARESLGMPPLSEPDNLFLCNLAADPNETTNVAKQHPDIVQRLSGYRREYMQDIGER